MHQTLPPLSDPCDPEALGRRLVEICELCEEHLRSLPDAERDRFVQRALAQAMGTTGRFRMTLMLSDMAHAIVTQRQAPTTA